MMNGFNPDDFEEILDEIRDNISSFVECHDIRSIESNFNTKGMMFGSTTSPGTDGTIILGEDDGHIVVDISVADGEILSFILEDENDTDGIENIIGWFEENYR